MPRGPFFDFHVVDDRVGIMFVLQCEQHSSGKGRRDTVAFDTAGAKYLEHGLTKSEDKRVRKAPRGTVLGGYFDGVSGDLGAIPLRLVALCEVTLEIVVLGVATLALH